MTRTTTPTAPQGKRQHVRIYQDDAWYTMSPSICRTATGDLLVSFRRAPNRLKQDRANLHFDTDSHIAIIRSTDGGATWSKPFVMPHDAASPTGQQAGNLSVLRDGRILLTSFEWTHRAGRSEEDLGGPHHFTRGYHRWARNNPWDGAFEMTGGLVAHSDDHGHSFSPWRRVSLPPDRYLGGLCSIQGSCADLPDGRVLLPVYAANIKDTTRGRACAYAAVCMVSDDRGMSFRFLAPIAQNPDPRGQGFDEPSLCRTRSGQLVAFLRATFEPEDAIWLARSRDAGTSWNLERLNGVIGHPTKGIRLADDRVLMVYGYRHLPDAGVRCRILDPECDHVRKAPEIMIRTDGVPADHPPDANITMDFGYPCATEIAPGEVLVVYYFPDPVSGCRIEGTRLFI